MTVVRVAWFVLALATGVLGSLALAWPVYEITDCEIGLSLSSTECNTPVGQHFGAAAILVLAVPVVLCSIPCVLPRPPFAWGVAVAMVLVSALGFWSAFTSSTPSLLSLVGSAPGAILAVVLAALGSGFQAQSRNRIRRVDPTPS